MKIFFRSNPVGSGFRFSLVVPCLLKQELSWGERFTTSLGQITKQLINVT